MSDKGEPIIGEKVLMEVLPGVYKKVAVVQQEHTEPLEPKQEYLIYSPDDGRGFQLGEIKQAKLGNTFVVVKAKEPHRDFLVQSEQIIARSTNPVMLRMQMEAAQAVERRIRPYWQAALEHAARIENMMREEVLKVARGEK